MPRQRVTARNLRRVTTVMCWTAALALLYGGTAEAAVRAIGVSPATGPPLATVRITGSGFCPPPCGPVAISIGSLYVASNITIRPSGGFQVFVRMPGTVRPGPVAITATQTIKGGRVESAQTTFTVTPGQPPPITYPPPSSSQPPGGLPPPSGKPTTARPNPQTPSPSPSQETPSPPSQAGPPAATSSAASQSQSARSAAARTTGGGGTLTTWLLGAGLLAAACAVGAWLWLRRRRAPGNPT
jgi:hypothetical protein